MRFSRHLITRLGAAAMTVLAPAFFLPGADAASMTRVSVGQEPPPFELPDLSGVRFSSSSLAGSPAAIIFWSTWSPRSEEMLSDFRGYFAEYSGRGLRMAAVNIDAEHLGPDRRRAVEEYAARLALPFPVLVDEGLETFAAYGVVAHPSALILDAVGKITMVVNGYPETIRADVKDEFLKVLGLYVPPEKPEAAIGGYVPKGGALQLHNLGRQMMERGQEEKALDYFARAAERDPSYLEPVIASARLLLAGGEVEKGEALLKKLDPDSVNRADVRFLLGYLLLQKGNASGAEAVFRSVREKYPADGLGLWGIGLAAMARGENVAAAEAMEEAARGMPRCYEAETWLRRHLGGLWMTGQSAPEEERLIRLFPALAETRERYRRLFQP